MNNNEMVKRINELKKEKNAIVLAHYYQDDAVQDVADYLGDSLELSKIARDSDADIIVFAGVHFMGETAKLLAPSKTILMPDLEAGCPMADRASYEDIKAYKEENPETKVICYVNSSLAVKALSDVCVTSSSAVKIVKEFAKPGDKLLYVPDKNLGTYLKNLMPELDLEVWPGFCCIHEAIRDIFMEMITTEHPGTKVIMHPECHPSAISYANYVGSTSQLLNWVKENKPKKVIVATEKGIIHQMKKFNPDCEYILAHDVLSCRQMKKVSMDKILNSLETGEGEMILDQDYVAAAKKPVELMLDITA